MKHWPSFCGWSINWYVFLCTRTLGRTTLVSSSFVLLFLFLCMILACDDDIHQNVSSSAATLAELKHAKKQVKKQLQRAESTLQDVQVTVQVVVEAQQSSSSSSNNNNINKFSHITATELYERSALCHTSRERLQRAQAELQSETVQAKLRVLGQEDRPQHRTTASAVPTTTTSTDRTAAYTTGDPQARQSLLMEHQDETLEDLGVAATRVNSMAGNIHEELGQQNKMLTDMEDDLANAEEELGMVMGKLAKFLQTKNQWQLGTIVCLSVTVVVLFFMVLYF